ncbi:MAG TPA: enoyl-CoA hydratase/isomerase family protein [Gemmatimonadales bacterium]|jgi:2-(1,2-epoxy-1,2-dihydrophenyl)acetyl-CoA isomerase|nr:enoyl-CoA hydratase/isomerase family protein [Gemmatimonadales bacterium]
MAAFDKVLVEISTGVATIMLHRPEKLNALDLELCQDLIAALETVSTSEQVRVIVLTGAGRGFCAGADLNVLGPQGNELVEAGVRIARLIREARQPVIAAVNGAAAGGGANLALACDYRIASDQAKIGQVFHKLGLGIDWGGSFFLPRAVGTARALELVWSARMVPASEALTLGLFQEVVSAESLMARARELALVWAGYPVDAVRRTKVGLYASEGRTLPQMLEWEMAQQRELFVSADARERIARSL